MQREGVPLVSGIETHFPRDKKQNEIYKIFGEFWKEHFPGNIPENVAIAGDKVYISPVNLNLRGVQIVRSGVFAGTVRNGRFVPEHALFNNAFFVAERFIDLSLDDDRVYKFLHGEEIVCDEALKGYTQVKLCGIPLGFGKASNGKLKNHYPKGLRML